MIKYNNNNITEKICGDCNKNIVPLKPSLLVKFLTSKMISVEVCDHCVMQWISHHEWVLQMVTVHFIEKGANINEINMIKYRFS